MSICDLCQLSSPSGCTKLSNEGCLLKDALKLIKASATNSDVIQALYPDATNYGIHDGLVHICLDNRTITIFTSSWWNAPYTGHWR